MKRLFALLFTLVIVACSTTPAFAANQIRFFWGDPVPAKELLQVEFCHNDANYGPNPDRFPCTTLSGAARELVILDADYRAKYGDGATYFFIRPTATDGEVGIWSGPVMVDSMADGIVTLSLPGFGVSVEPRTANPDGIIFDR